MTDTPPESQEMRRQYFSLISAQVIFLANNEVQMLTKQSFGSSPDPTYPAKYLLQLQNTLGHQVKQQIEQGGGTFDKLIDITISTIVPLGLMSHDEFWAGMDTSVPEVEALAQQMPEATPALPPKGTSIQRKPKKKT